LDVLYGSALTASSFPGVPALLSPTIEFWSQSMPRNRVTKSYDMHL